MSLIDQVDEQNNIIGPVDRKRAHDEGLWHRAVSIWLYSKTGKVLVQRRASTVSEAPGKLDISVAGHVEAGDTVENTVLKELKEELGISVAPAEIGEPTMFRYDFPSQTTGRQHRRFAYIYFIKIDEDTAISFDDGEVEEVLWVDYKNFQDLILTANFRSHSPEYMQIVTSKLAHLCS